MRRVAALLLALGAAAAAQAAPPMVVLGEAEVMKREPPPHNGQGMTTAYRYSDFAPGRTMEFRKRVLHKGASIGLHLMKHDEVYYVLAGEGEVTSDGVTRRLTPGMAAYLYTGANVGLRQVGEADLVIILAYPIPTG